MGRVLEASHDFTVHRFTGRPTGSLTPGRENMTGSKEERERREKVKAELRKILDKVKGDWTWIRELIE